MATRDDDGLSVVRETVHRGDDDLLSAGLGLVGLQSMLPPAVADPGAPSAAEQRRGAVWSNWRGIVDVSRLTRLDAVPGREFHGLLRLPGAGQAHRVLLQVPDSFDREARCLLVTASSGSRGIYGALAVAGHWGLPRGCAVVYTDKACGCDWFDPVERVGIGLDGRPARLPGMLAFSCDSGGVEPRVLMKHAHSGDNPEADWGRHLRQAAEFGLAMLERALPGQGPFGFDNTRVIGTGVSNGGAAVLRAAADDAPWLAGAVVGAANVQSPAGGRALYDYGTEAALWMLAAQAAGPLADAPLPTPLVEPAAVEQARLAAIDALCRHGLVARGSAAATAERALRHLRAAGWSDAALRAGTISTAFEMWRALGVTYSWAYGRFPAECHPIGYRFAMVDGERRPRMPSAGERAAWWSLGAGIAPGAGVEIIEPAGHAGDPWPGLLRLRGWVDGADADARRVQGGIAACRAGLPRADLPLLVMHGLDDGLIPEAFSSGPYVRACRQGGRAPTYWRLPQVQHFDTFLGLPVFGACYRPLLPVLHRGLDAMWAHLYDGVPLPEFDEAMAGEVGGSIVADQSG
jgi:hydroxybutyrate-dimer hydrolase